MATKNKPTREPRRGLPSILKELTDQFVSSPMNAEAIQEAIALPI
ncbi:hypothetical protein SOM46_23720 [Pseudomonas fluorescens]|nr:hypothetical protein [Pseudomonas fluorescens]MDY0897945.1 hypothetical protein [Pseudomonas fluorescens]